MLDGPLREVEALVQAHAFLRSFIDLDRTDHALRFRLIIDETLFIQVYANSAKAKYNLALISMGRRVFGRDSEAGVWHTHPFDSLESHLAQEDAGKPVTLTEFIAEVEELLLRESLL